MLESNTSSTVSGSGLEHITKEDALNYFTAFGKMFGVRVDNPKEYFSGKVQEITNRLARERSLDPNGEEMLKIRDGFSTEAYFGWLEGVLRYQKAYLKAFEQ